MFFEPDSIVVDNDPYPSRTSLDASRYHLGPAVLTRIAHALEDDLQGMFNDYSAGGEVCIHLEPGLVHRWKITHESLRVTAGQ